MIKAVFFDLDGTFADTAPDLNFTLKQMQALALVSRNRRLCFLAGPTRTP